MTREQHITANAKEDGISYREAAQEYDQQQAVNRVVQRYRDAQAIRG